MIETVKSNKSDDQDGTFDRNYTEVKRITTLTSKNGVVKVGKGKDSKLVPVPDGTKVPFTGNMKIVYAYLFTFQDNDKRHDNAAPIHPNMGLIAWENGITKPTAQKAVDALMQAGVLIKGHIQVGGGFMSNNYVVLKPSKVVTMGITPSHPNEAKSKNQKLEEVEQNGKSESKEPNHAAVEPSALGNGEQYSIRQPADHRGHDVSPGDDEVDAPPFPEEKQKPEQPEHKEQVKPFEGPIFDKNGVVIEAFINSLKGADEPKRNTDGTLQKYGFAYAMARAYQADRDGILSHEEIRDSITPWIKSALPEHIPAHLLPKPAPELKPKPEPEPEFDTDSPF